MIRDEIDFLEREYRDMYRGQPEVLKLSPENVAILREELEIDPEEDLSMYHGMYIEVDEYYDLELGSQMDDIKAVMDFEEDY